MALYDVIIVGGGASGLVAAIVLAKRNKKVLIIEKGNKVGKKILASGNGRCNLSNVKLNSIFYNTDVSKYLSKIGNNETINFFKKLGLETYADEEGRVYPVSNYATSVMDVLMREIERLNIPICINEEITKIFKEKNFVLESNTQIFSSKQVLLCFGGNSSLQILNSLNIMVNPFTPSLASLKCNCPKLLSGIRIDNVMVTLKFVGESHSELGEVLFKENAISGIVVFNLSSVLARRKTNNATISLSLSQKSREELFKEFELRKQNLSELIVKDFFIGMFKKELASFLIEKSLIKQEKRIKDLSEKELFALVKIVKNLSFNVFGICDNNQVHSGGVPLCVVDETLQAKGLTGLYLAGEVLDVDGVCGGFNLQWAWTSGIIVGESI